MLDLDIPGKRSRWQPTLRRKDDRGGAEREQHNKQGSMEESDHQLYRRPQMMGKPGRKRKRSIGRDTRWQSLWDVGQYKKKSPALPTCSYSINSFSFASASTANSSPGSSEQQQHAFNSSIHTPTLHPLRLLRITLTRIAASEICRSKRQFSSFVSVTRTPQQHNAMSFRFVQLTASKAFSAGLHWSRRITFVHCCRPSNSSISATTEASDLTDIAGDRMASLTSSSLVCLVNATSATSVSFSPDKQPRTWEER